MRMYKGIVQKGTKRGTALGFPTANIPLDDAKVSGVYAARVVLEGEEFPAAAFADGERKILESYLLDFPSEGSGDLYGKEIEITLEKKIREAEKFDDDAVLRTTITDDVKKVQEYFKKAST